MLGRKRGSNLGVLRSVRRGGSSVHTLRGESGDDVGLGRVDDQHLQARVEAEQRRRVHDQPGAGHGHRLLALAVAVADGLVQPPRRLHHVVDVQRAGTGGAGRESSVEGGQIGRQAAVGVHARGHSLSLAGALALSLGQRGGGEGEGGGAEGVQRRAQGSEGGLQGTGNEDGGGLGQVRAVGGGGVGDTGGDDVGVGAQHLQRVLLVQVALLGQVAQDQVHSGLHGGVVGVEGQLHLRRVLVRVAVTSHLDLALLRALVQTLHVALLAQLQGGGDVDDHEAATGGGGGVAGGGTGGLEGGDGAGDGDTAVTRDLGGHPPDAGDVGVAVVDGEAEALAQVRADDVTIQDGDGAGWVGSGEALHQRGGDGGLARARQAGEEDGEPTARLRGLHLAQDVDDVGVGEPVGDVVAGSHHRAELGAGQLQHLGAVGDLVVLHVGVRGGHVHQHLERDQLDADLIAERQHQLLGVVRTVEVVAGGALAAGVVTADNEVGRAVVLADQRVPQCLTRTSHAHGQRQQAQEHAVLAVVPVRVLQDLLVAPHAGGVVDVAGLGHANHGVDEHAALDLLGGTAGELDVGTVHGVARLERDEAAPAHLLELGARLGGREAKVVEVEVLGQADALQRAADVHVTGLVEEVVDGRVAVVGGAQHHLCLVGLVDGEHVVDGQHGDEVEELVAQGDLLANSLVGSEVSGHIEGDGHGPHETTGQPHVVDDAVVGLLVHEAGQRGEATVQQHFDVAQLASGQDQVGKVGRHHLDQLWVGVDACKMRAARSGREHSPAHQHTSSARSGEAMMLTRLPPWGVFRADAAPKSISCAAQHTSEQRCGAMRCRKDPATHVVRVGSREGQRRDDAHGHKAHLGHHCDNTRLGYQVRGGKAGWGVEWGSCSATILCRARHQSHRVLKKLGRVPSCIIKPCSRRFCSMSMAK